MKEKKMNLKTWMCLKIVPAAFFLMYYWMCARTDFQPYYMYIQKVIFYAAGLLVGVQIAYAKKRDIFDEFAKKNLKITDSICMKVAYVLMVATGIACVVPAVSGKIAGYCVVISILLLTILRAVIFCIIDKKGM